VEVRKVCRFLEWAIGAWSRGEGDCMAVKTANDADRHSNPERNKKSMREMTKIVLPWWDK